jgi:hypothetical protein
MADPDIGSALQSVLVRPRNKQRVAEQLPTMLRSGEVILPNGMESTAGIKLFFECFDPKSTSLPKLASS